MDYGFTAEMEVMLDEVAEGRAQSVVDYLVSQGIDPARFIVEAVLPPVEHRNSARTVPVQRIRPRGDLAWMVDRDAAGDRRHLGGVGRGAERVGLAHT